jgi:hypothetical protein
VQCLDPKVLQEETVLPLNSKGPDFMRIRPQSVIADAPLVTLDRNERVRLMSKFRVLCRRSWVSKETGKHRGLVTRTAESVFGALLYLTEKYGRVFPSLEGLAHLGVLQAIGRHRGRRPRSTRLRDPHPPHPAHQHAARLHHAADHECLQSA